MMTRLLRCLGAILFLLAVSFGVIRLGMYVSPDFRLWVYHVRDHVIMEKIFPITDVFWVHRCDDLRKMQEMSDIYAGVELDIIYVQGTDKGEFDVSHDPQPTVEHPLNEFLSLMGDKNTKIWLDFKNLNELNAGTALAELERLTQEYNIDKKRLILESDNYAELAAFHKQGYYTSYYCPLDDERYLHSDEHREEFRQLVNTAVQSGNVDAVSFDCAYYPLIKESRVNVDLLTWRVGHYGWWDFYVDEPLKAILEDEQVKVILVSDHSPYER